MLARRAAIRHNGGSGAQLAATLTADLAADLDRQLREPTAGDGMQRPIVHPAIDELRLESVLYALADPVRLCIVRNLAAGGCPMNCSSTVPKALPKSTQSYHFQVLREAGIIRSERRGTEVVNTLRCHEIEQRFPGVISAILAASAATAKIEA
jgi:DNA-binding transcriptional ArsR family regulator